MIGALRWISYINVSFPQFFLTCFMTYRDFLKAPRYAFESIMANEFHTLNGSCASLVPLGLGYEGVGLSNQVCTTPGSVAGQDYVDGNQFIGLSYDYSYSHVWMVCTSAFWHLSAILTDLRQNFGILVAFLGGFIAALLVFSEFRTSTSFDAFRVLFKRGSKSPIIEQANAAADEEKSLSMKETASDYVPEKGEKALAEQPPMTDVFSWQHLRYTVHTPQGDRVLLNDVSGYVAPGKLTALMGESGAGKVRRLVALFRGLSSC